jgi:hypothetical protein
MLGPVEVDAERDHAQVVGEVHPVDHHRDQVKARQVTGHQLAQRSLGHRHELAGHRRLALRS